MDENPFTGRPDPEDRSEYGGRNRHLALCVEDFDAIRIKLDSAQIP